MHYKETSCHQTHHPHKINKPTHIFSTPLYAADKMKRIATHSLSLGHVCGAAMCQKKTSIKKIVSIIRESTAKIDMHFFYF